MTAAVPRRRCLAPTLAADPPTRRLPVPNLTMAVILLLLSLLAAYMLLTVDTFDV